MDGRPLLVRIARASSEMFRVVNDDAGLQVDFLARIAAVRSFESLQARATRVDLDGSTLLVADLGDIFKSKAAAGRPKDRAVLAVIRKTLNEIRKEKPPR